MKHINFIQTYFKDYKFVALFNSNAHSAGFKNCIYLSNKESSETIVPGKNYIAFINYDHKNDVENFPEKENNPLTFPKQLFIEAEKKTNQYVLTCLQTAVSMQPITIQPTVTKQEYISKVSALKQHIQLGDIYEINYCITFEAHDVTIDPIALYQKLNAISNAPYSALAKFENRYIVSSSPELFLSKKGNTVITKPIKGTAKRGLTPQEDEIIKQNLKSNLKERTENVMIVDVARNDLSRIAVKGSVTVEKLCEIESYSQVHQMVSTVSCELKENTFFKAIIDAAFPMASMTGAPKHRAMQLIDDYEIYNRGPYSGSLGYIEANGDFNLNVLIRSVFYDEEKHYLSFTVGSAITAMCNPEEEYEECLLKAYAMIKALE